MPLLLQVVAPTYELSIGAAIAYCVGAIGIATAIYKMGANSADTRNLRTSVTGALDQMNSKLDAITLHIDASQQQRVDDAEWKGEFKSRLETAERELSVLNRRRES